MPVALFEVSIIPLSAQCNQAMSHEIPRLPHVCRDGGEFTASKTSLNTALRFPAEPRVNAKIAHFCAEGGGLLHSPLFRFLAREVRHGRPTARPYEIWLADGGDPNCDRSDRARRGAMANDRAAWRGARCPAFHPRARYATASSPPSSIRRCRRPSAVTRCASGCSGAIKAAGTSPPIRCLSTAWSACWCWPRWWSSAVVVRAHRQYRRPHRAAAGRLRHHRRLRRLSSTGIHPLALARAPVGNAATHRRGGDGAPPLFLGRERRADYRVFADHPRLVGERGLVHGQIGRRATYLGARRCYSSSGCC